VRLLGNIKTDAGGDIEEMLSKIEEIEQRLVSNSSLPPLTVFNHALVQCAKAAKAGAGRMAVSYAFRVLQGMREHGVTRNVHTYGPLIDTCAKAGALKECALAMRMMKDDGIAPNVITYSAYVSAFAASAAAGDRSAPSKVFPLQPHTP